MPLSIFSGESSQRSFGLSLFNVQESDNQCRCLSVISELTHVWFSVYFIGLGTEIQTEHRDKRQMLHVNEKHCGSQTFSSAVLFILFAFTAILSSIFWYMLTLLHLLDISAFYNLYSVICFWLAILSV